MNKLVIISGHSRGLGKALAQYYLDKGYQVVGLARQGWVDVPAALHQIDIDLSRADSLIDWLSTHPFQKWLDKADEVILINNAGVVEPNALIGQQNPESITQAININIMASFVLTNAVIAAVLEKKLSLRVAHISSGAARQAYPGWSIYGATKAALDQHAEVVAAEKRPQVRIASIAPGVVGTDMQAQIRAADDSQFPLRHKFVDLYAEKKLQSPQETAQKIADMIAAPSYGDMVKRDVRE